MDGRDHSRSNLYLNLHSLPRYASFSHLLPLYPSQCGSITRHVNADRNGLPALALPLYASSRCHFMLQGTDSVTSPIGVQSWNHSFAKIGRIALGLRAALPDEQPTVLYLFGLPNQDQLHDCKGMLPIGTPRKPMLPNLNFLNCWGLPSQANLRGMHAIHCKPMLPAVQTFG